jgi:hypothetical protein
MNRRTRMAAAVVAGVVVVAGVGFALRHRAGRSWLGGHSAHREGALRSAGSPAAVGTADNPGVQSVREASANKTHPERLSPLIPAHPFDQAAFEADPQAYLDVVEPGRCFQTLQSPGPDSVYLQAGASGVRAAEGKPIVLMVKGAPRAPVTFTAFGPGQFTENTLGSISVRGDANGHALVHFAAPAGFVGRIPVLVGSPLAIGNQRIMVEATTATVAAQ